MRLLGTTLVAGLLAITAGLGCAHPNAVTVEAPRPASGLLTPAQIAARSTPAIVSIRSPESLGTGFVVQEDGWIATNLHVIAGAKELIVVLPDKSEHSVEQVIAFDEDRDLALVKIDVKGLPVLTLGDSRGVHPGDPVVAIGHPLGLEDTVSNGLVSAVRVVDPTLTILQISAPIAPGSSGGPLFNDHGEVIGVAAAVITEGQNLNFGVPSVYLKNLLKHPEPVSFAKFAEDSAGQEEGPRLPTVTRAVPHHDVGILQGCKDSDLETLGTLIEGAIEVGAPLYNDGNFAACYHVYEGAALDAERKVGATCRGPKKALGDGRKRAAKLEQPAEQAWAMRDAFDGVIDVIERKLKGDKK